MSQPQARQNQHMHRDRKRPRNHRHDRPRAFKSNHKDDTVPLCSVCEKEPKPKYKCPKCRATYCSIACCRQHKETGCVHESLKPPAAATSSKYITDASKLPSGPIVANKRSNRSNENEDDWEEGWKITSEMKTRLHESDWLQQELKDAGLRQLLVQLYEASNVVAKKKRYEVDSANTEQEQMLEKMKEDNPQFKLFLDKLLLITGVLEYSGNEPISQLLSRDLNDLREHLTLAPSRRILPASASDIVVDSSDSDEEESSSSSSDEDSTSDDSSSSHSDTS